MFGKLVICRTYANGKDHTTALHNLSQNIGHLKIPRRRVINIKLSVDDSPLAKKEEETSFAEAFYWGKMHEQDKQYLGLK